MPRHLHLDFETFSKADIRGVGAYRYAFDPSTEILCAAMALDDGEPVMWREGWSLEHMEHGELYYDALLDPEVLIYAHNAMFEMAICQALLQRTWGIPCPALSRFRCTMSLARRAALPSKLEKLAKVLQLQNQKDKKGASLIKRFCQINEWRVSKKHPEGGFYRVKPEDDPVQFAELMAYCAQDVRTEQEVARKLAYFGDALNDSNYSLDAVINARGVPVNLTALRHAQRLIDEETAILSQKFRALTGFEITQNARFLVWLKEQGVDLPDLQAETIENFLVENI